MTITEASQTKSLCEDLKEDVTAKIQYPFVYSDTKNAHKILWNFASNMFGVFSTMNYDKQETKTVDPNDG